MALGSISNFWLDGRPSGLPENIEDQMAEVRRQQTVEPITEDIEEAKSLKQTLTNFSSVISQLVQTVDPLASGQSFETNFASSSNTDVVGVSADSSAVRGSYDITVTGLAQAHTHSVGVDVGLDDDTDPSLIASDMQISFFHQGEEFSYTTDSSTTLQSLADSINQEDNGVRATVNNTGTEDTPEYVLILKSDSTGAGSNLITKDGDPANTGVQITDTLGTGRTNLFEVDTFAQAETQPGANAEFSVDGVDYVRSSNQISDVIDGVELELKDSGSSSVQVVQDSNTLLSRVSDFVKVYNAARGFIDSRTDYDSENDEAGPLMGSSLANGVERKLANLIQTPVSTGGFTYLSEVGITVQRNGSLEFDETAFSQALAQDPEGVQSLFAGDNGLAQQMKTAMTAYTDTYSGLITNRIESIEDNIQSLQEQKEDAQDDVQRYLERTVAKFTAMENAIIQYQSMQEHIDSMTQTWKAMNK
jgi:flagellar hook-associated protein 2